MLCLLQLTSKILMQLKPIHWVKSSAQWYVFQRINSWCQLWQVGKVWWEWYLFQRMKIVQNCLLNEWILGNSFILIQYESKIILLCIYFFWRLLFHQENSLLYSHCYFLNLWPVTFWTQIEQSCHCEIVKVKIVGQVTSYLFSLL